MRDAPAKSVQPLERIEVRDVRDHAPEIGDRPVVLIHVLGADAALDRTAEYASDSVVAHAPSSGTFVRPTTMRPACRNFSTRYAVVGWRYPTSRKKRGPPVVRVARRVPAREILQEEWRAAERTVRQRPPRFGTRAVVVPMNDGVQPRVQTLDARDRLVDELERRRVTAANEFRLRGSVEVGEVVAHGRTLVPRSGVKHTKRVKRV